ncbi:hypothetical protein SAMN05444000_103262 [Shimia gijangensis]|uniref:Uncharacterized protein n=1 Tax=Shimia gijangensis TaxID=1470563 RepID=A0A1M6EPN8_9RHOB|nr:hypothetical protein SAMN05444000_103262 [Shimia gijangensis]
MNTALLIIGVIVLLVVAAAIAEAYLRGQRYKPLSSVQPQNVARRALGQDATTTSILQDMLADRQRLKSAQSQKETRQ